MTTEINVKKQIYQIIETLPVERLPDLLNFLRQFLQPSKPEKRSNIAPIYQIHHQAVDTGIPNLAAQHDRYLYGTDKNSDRLY